MIYKLRYRCAIAVVVGSVGMWALNPMASIARAEMAEKVSEISMGEGDHEHDEEMSKEMQDMMAQMQQMMSKMQEHFGQMTPEQMEEHHEKMTTNMQEIMAKMEEMEGMMGQHQH